MSTNLTSDLSSNLMNRYAKNSLLRGLVALIPYVGGALDTVATVRWQNIKEARLRGFFDELANQKVALNDDLVNSNDFLHCFMISARAAENTRTSEKLKLFARLLASSFSERSPRSIDEFEEFISIIDDLSLTEWQALAILDRYSSFPRDSAENDLQWTLKFWAEFREAVENELKIPHDEFESFMNRITRTGLYDSFAGAYLDYSGGQGKLSSRYRRLKRFVSRTAA